MTTKESMVHKVNNNIDTMPKTRGRTLRNNESLQNIGDDSGEWTHQDLGTNGEPQPAESETNKKRASRSGKALAAPPAVAATTRSTRNKRGCGGNNSKATKQYPTLMSDPRLTKALDEAKYEAFTDPYRGVMPYFILDNNDNGQEELGGMTKQEALNAKSPWKNCAQILMENSSSWTFATGEEGKVEVVNVDEDDEPKNKNDEDETALVVQCGCPTVDKWAMDELEAYNKQKNAKKKKGGKGKKKKNNDTSGKDGEEVIIVDDENLLPAENSSNGKKVGHHLICGERKCDAKYSCPCDYNPVRECALGDHCAFISRLS